MSEVAILLLTILLLSTFLLIVLAFIGLGMLIYLHYKFRNLRDQVDGIFDTCANVDESLAYMAQQEQITAVQN